MDDAVAKELMEAWGEFIVALRLGDGYCDDKFLRLRAAMESVRDAWQDAEVVRKDAASVLVEMFSSVDAAGHLYKGEEADQIRAAAEDLQELASACVAGGDSEGEGEA
jgi:hypothetical protein